MYVYMVNNTPKLNIIKTKTLDKILASVHKNIMMEADN